MTWPVFFGCLGVVLWMAALTLVLPGSGERDSRRNGFKARTKR